VKNPLTPYQISCFLIHNSVVENLWKLKSFFNSLKEDAFPHPSTTPAMPKRGKVENLFSTAATKGFNLKRPLYAVRKSAPPPAC
jgi:hypothetical protein